MVYTCIENKFKDNLNSKASEIVTVCSGQNFSIILRNFQEAKQRIKIIFVELIRIKLIDIDPEYDDEINYFLNILELYIDRDFKIKQSLNASIE